LRSRRPQKGRLLLFPGQSLSISPTGLIYTTNAFLKFMNLPNHPDTTQTPARLRVLILGGGFGGLEACRALNTDDYEITLIDRQNHHLFQPLLYQVATCGLSAPEIAQPLRMILSQQRNVRILMAEITSVDLASRQVHLADQSLEYDYLIMALGARTGYFGHPEWEEFAPGLKSLADATRIRREVLSAYERAEAATDKAEIESLLTTVVIGGGPTGVEMAGALAELAHHALKGEFRNIDPMHAKFILVDASPRILGMFHEDLSRYATQHLSDMGVRVLTNMPVSEVGPGYVICGGERINAANMIWAAGVEASPLTQSLGVKLDRAGRVEVAADCSLPGYPEVFAIGDMAMLVDKNGIRVPGVSPAAMQMGKHVAGVIAEEQRRARLIRAGRKLSTQLNRPAFAYWDKGSMATIGRSAAVAEVGKIRLRGYIAWLAWLFIHLLFLVGLRNKIAVVGQWIYAYFTYKRGARIIIRPDGDGS
jgi:NADH dehydrogenase